MRIWKWFAVALLLRLIAARTQLSYGHPDEWTQTVEYANYLAFGFLSHTHEFYGHLRNLTWPVLMSGVLSIADTLYPGSIEARFYSIKILTGLLDLVILWALDRMMVARGWSDPWRRAGWLLFLFAWPLLSEAVRPSQEHLSAIAFWAFLGVMHLNRRSLCNGPWMRELGAGFFLALSAVFRYPSGLFAVGASLAFLIRREDRWQNLALLLGGAMAGLLAGGLADWVVYGRPLESFWMYFQYNVLTGLSSQNFGTQSAIVYWNYFRGFFSGPLLPLGLLALVLVPYGLGRDLLRREPWAWASATYLLGHLLISHKEPRFMAPLIHLTLWAGLVGARNLAKRLPRPKRFVGVGLRTVGVLLIAINLIFLLRTVWGETWRKTSNYLELSSLLEGRNYGKVCAVVTVQRPVSVLFPWKSTSRVPDPALGWFPAPAHEPTSQYRFDHPLIWLVHSPDCRPGERVLLQPHRPEGHWSERGCILRSVGILSLVPEERWPDLLEKRWVSAPWYDCPQAVLTEFTRQEVRDVLGWKVTQFPELPSIGISGEDFQNWILRQNHRSDLGSDGTMSNW